MRALLQSLPFPRGPEMKNRFMLAPLTNLQSHADGRLSAEEYRWLTLRAAGGFGLVMTCAAHVQAIGQGFPGQLGVFADRHVEGLSRLVAGIKAHGSLAFIQLHHAGLGAPPELIGCPPVAPSAHPESGARALSLPEIEALVDAFTAAAERAETAGFDGIELHGAHAYLICQFPSAETNQREDRYGGSLENRCRLLMEILAQLRARCRPDLLISVRLSPEAPGMLLDETVEIAGRLLASGLIDLLHMSLWDVFKEPRERPGEGRSLLDHFTALPRNGVRLAVAGAIRSPADAEKALEAGADIIALGRGAILQADFPLRYARDRQFEPKKTPVSPEYLRGQGVSETFVEYLRKWQGFVEGS